MEFRRYNNCRTFMLFDVALTLIFLPLMLLLGARWDNAGKYIILILLFEPVIFPLFFEIDAQFGAFYDTVYCDENGVAIKTRKKTIKLPWDEVKYIRALRTKGALVGWEINAVDGEKYKMYPPPKEAIMDYINSLQLNVEVRT